MTQGKGISTIQKGKKFMQSTLYAASDIWESNYLFYF
jgi:hypothetical protein